jgi:1-phosphofructokinase
MIVTVTPNTTIDRTLFVPSFELNSTIRARRAAVSTGGKPEDVSFILGGLGIPSLALGFAAGPAGQKVEDLLRQRGVMTDFVWVDGETRVNVIVVCDDGSGQTIFTVDTLEVSDAHVEALRSRYVGSLGDATCIVLGGTMPHGLDPSLYTDFVRKGRERGIPVVFDASGPYLHAGLMGIPTAVKPNRDELAEISGEPIPNVDAAYHAARRLQAQYGVTTVVVSLDREGVIGVLPDRAYRIPIPRVEVVSTAGAGDGVLAGLAVALSREEPIEEGLRLGVAAASAICLTAETADCRPTDVERLLPTIELIPYGLQA